MSIKVFLADDHAIVRDGLRALLEAEPDIEVVGDADNGRDAVLRATEIEPDILIVDIAMPELNGIEAARQVMQSCPSTRTIVLSMHSTSEHIFRALHIGASGYLLKESAGAEVINAVHAVQYGRRYFSQKISDNVIYDFIHYHEKSGSVSPLERLSHREREILYLVIDGKTSAAIGELLNLSPKTVDTYRSRLMRKLDVPDLPALIRFAIEHNLASSL